MSWEFLCLFQLSFSAAPSAIYYDSIILYFLSLPVVSYMNSVSYTVFCVPFTFCLL